MTIPMIRIMVFSLVLLVGGIAGAAPEAGKGRTSLTRYLTDFRTMRASFEQLLLDEYGGTLEEAKGTVYLRRPGRFRWDYETPYEQSIVADGQQVWIYDKELKQVTVKPLQSAIGNTPALLLDSQIDIDKEFTVSELGQADGLLWLSLKPKGEEKQFADIRLGFEGTALRLMELFDNLGQKTRIRFSGEQRNSRLDPSLFVFKTPPGVDVLHAKDM